MTSRDRLSDLTRRNALQGLGGVLAAAGLPAVASSTVEAATSTEQFGPHRIERDDENGFNFPYFLYAPSNTRDKPLLVEPVNSGSPSDDMQDHLDAAENLIQSGLSRTISDELNVPFLVPVIKDPASGELGELRTQSLDTGTMNIESGRYARIDRQVVAMVDDARDRLSELGYNIPAEFMLNGFSQSGNFGNNLALLQPDRITSVTAGGVNGMAVLPRSEVNGESIPYQIGTADMTELTGSPFDAASWQDVAQLCYMGATERSPTDDTLPYRNLWSDSQARQALAVYGETMQLERMVVSDSMYQDAGAEARLTVYDDVGHDNSAPKIVRDVLGFHKRNLNLPYITIIRGQTGGAETVEAEVFVPPGDSDTLEVRAFRNGTEATADPTPIRRGDAHRLTLSLTSPLELGDTLEIAVCELDEPALEAAVHTVEHQVVLDATLQQPTPGDTSIDIEYEVGSERVPLSVVTDSGALYWQRRTRRTVGPDESGTETIAFSPSAEGIPVEAGDELQLQANFSAQPRRLRSTVDTLTVAESESYDPATRCLGGISHDAVEIDFTAPPTVNADTVAFSCRVGDEFAEPIQPVLFPNTGSGRWGISSDWDIDAGWQSFGSVAPGSSVTDSYAVPENTFTPADTPALGESVEIRAYPGSTWSLDDHVASACAPISGVRFTEPPTAASDTVSVKYYYPPSFDQSGQLRVVVNETTVGTVDDLAPGTLASQAVSVDDGATIETADSVSVTIGPTAGTAFDDTAQIAHPANPGSVEFESPPRVLDSAVTISYTLRAAVDTDRFLSLRLYTPVTPAWGIHLGRVEPGIDSTDQFIINTDEPAVPFQLGTDVTVKLVAWDDPYGTQPIAMTTTTIGKQQSVATYANPTTGAVETGGLRDAIADWRDGTINTTFLRDVIDAWRRGTVVV